MDNFIREIKATISKKEYSIDLDNPLHLAWLLRNENNIEENSIYHLEVGIKYGIHQKIKTISSSMPVSSIATNWAQSLMNSYPISSDFAVESILFWCALFDLQVDVNKNDLHYTPIESSEQFQVVDFLKKSEILNNIDKIEATFLLGQLKDTLDFNTRITESLFISSSYLPELISKPPRNITPVITKLADNICEINPVLENKDIVWALETWAIALGKKRNQRKKRTEKDSPKEANTQEKSNDKEIVAILYQDHFMLVDSDNQFVIDELVYKVPNLICKVQNATHAIFLSNQSRLYSIPLQRIKQSMGKAIPYKNLLELKYSERITNALFVNKNSTILLGSNYGRLEKVPAVEIIKLAKGRKVLPSVNENDHLHFLNEVSKKQSIIAITSEGNLFPLLEDALLVGTSRSYGKRMFPIRNHELVISLTTLDINHIPKELITISEKGYVKKISLKKLNLLEGKRVFKAGQYSGPLVSTCFNYTDSGEIIIRTVNSVAASFEIDKIPEGNLLTQGTKIVNLSGEDKISEIFCFSPMDNSNILVSILNNRMNTWIQKSNQAKISSQKKVVVPKPVSPPVRIKTQPPVNRYKVSKPKKKSFLDKMVDLFNDLFH